MREQNTPEETLFFIKPEAMPKEREIINRMYDSSLPLVKYRHFIMRPRDVEKLYSDKPLEIRQKLHKQLDNQELVLGLVNGKNAIKRLVEIAGHDSDPAKCKPGTIRHDYGNKADPSRIHENAIHRPKTPEEVQENLKILSHFL